MLLYEKLVTPVLIFLYFSIRTKGSHGQYFMNLRPVKPIVELKKSLETVVFFGFQLSQFLKSCLSLRYEVFILQRSTVRGRHSFLSLSQIPLRDRVE